MQPRGMTSASAGLHLARSFSSGMPSGRAGQPARTPLGDLVAAQAGRRRLRYLHSGVSAASGFKRRAGAWPVVAAQRQGAF
jgi:hypothetical protein